MPLVAWPEVRQSETHSEFNGIAATNENRA
jgi:hypothetical protein